MKVQQQKSVGAGLPVRRIYICLTEAGTGCREPVSAFIDPEMLSFYKISTHLLTVLTMRGRNDDVKGNKRIRQEE